MAGGRGGVRGAGRDGGARVCVCACVGGREAGLSKWMGRLPSAPIWHSAKEAGLPSARSGHSANIFFLDLNPKPHCIVFLKKIPLCRVPGGEALGKHF